MLKFDSTKRDLYFSSDLHCLHKNICYGTSVWENKEETTRKFDTPNEMTNHIIDNINNMVKFEDVLFLLGDLLFNYKDPKTYERILNRINCNQIHLLYGNHDNKVNLNEAVLNSSKIITMDDYLEVTIDKSLISLFHYPIEEWNNRHGKSYHLFGHVHGRIPHSNNRLDVGIDNAYKLFGEYRPFSWKEINNLLNE